MDIQRTESLLYQYEEFKIAIINLQDEINEIDQDIYSGFGFDYTKDKLSESYKFNSMTENAALKRIADNISKRKEELQQRMQSTISKVNRIERALITLDIEERNIITLYYFQKANHVKATMKLNISVPQYYKKKKKAVRKINTALHGI